jgi:hypothetical protein
MPIHGLTCFECLPAHHQEHTTAPGASAFTAGEQRPEHWWSWSGQTVTTNAPAVALQLLVQLCATDDGRGDAQNMLNHVWASSSRLVKLLNLVG